MKVIAKRSGMQISKDSKEVHIHEPLYLIEARDSNGKLDLRKEDSVRVEHSYLFSKSSYTMLEICRYLDVGPMKVAESLEKIGLTHRVIYW